MNGQLSDIIAGYLDLRWRMDPVAATQAGRHELDGVFGLWTDDAVREYAAAVRSYAAGLEEAEADSLDDEIDRTAALHAARHDVLVLERERPFAHDPSFHLTHALSGLYLLLARNAQDPVARSAALLARLQALPDFLAAAAEAVTKPRAPLVEMAQGMIAGGVSLVREGLEDGALDLSALDPGELDRSRLAAGEALEQFGDALAVMAESANDDVALGRELFDRKVSTAHMIGQNADELLRYGKQLRGEAVAQIERIGHEIDRAASWRDVSARVRADQPSPSSTIAEFADCVRRAYAFTVEHDLFAMPNAQLTVEPTPAFLRGLIPFAAYDPPGPFDEEQLGAFFVTVSDTTSLSSAFSRPQIATTVVHEAVPGHHMHLTTANRLDRPVRQVLHTPASLEGWALYCEGLMAEEGFLTTPEQRFAQAELLLWRAVRVIIDVSLHTRGMTVAQATRLLQDDLGFDAGKATAEVQRCCAYPTYQLCYAVGRRDLLRLRDDARRARGERFSLRDFHADVLAYGGLPTALVRWGMGLQ